MGLIGITVLASTVCAITTIDSITCPTDSPVNSRFVELHKPVTFFVAFRTDLFAC